MSIVNFKIFHISDLHEKGERENESWRRRRVLGDAWHRNIDTLAADGNPDIVCFTGDVADWGREEEYSKTTEFLQELMHKFSLPMDRLFVVPGNHDIQRKVEAKTWEQLRSDILGTDRLNISRWMAGGKPWQYLDDISREKILDRQSAYRKWVANDLGLTHLVGGNGKHKNLGWSHVLKLPKKYTDLADSGDVHVHIIGLDSAWLSGDDNDSGKLLLTDDQVMSLVTDDQGAPLSGFRLALIHHPLDDLADRSECRRLLSKHIDILLRGHLHETESCVWSDPESSLRQVATGCLYEGHGADLYSNTCTMLSVGLDFDGRPQRCEVHFRSWSTRGHWYDDDSFYAGSRGGRLLLFNNLPSSQCSFHPRVDSIFVGREEELGILKDTLIPAVTDSRKINVCSVQGMPGVGKSYLVDRFYASQREMFPGGYQRLSLNSTHPSDVNTLLDTLSERLEVSVAKQERNARLVAILTRRLTLVHIENVDSERAATIVVDLVNKLSSVPLVITGRFQGLGVDAGWVQISLNTPSEEDAFKQLSLELKNSAYDPNDVRELISTLGCLPLAIHLAAGYLRKGSSIERFLRKLREQKFDLSPADPADYTLQLDRAKAILSATFNVSLNILGSQFSDASDRFLNAFYCFGFSPASGFGNKLGASQAGLNNDDFEDLCVEAVGLSLLEEVNDFQEVRSASRWRLHTLLGEYLRIKADQEDMRFQVVSRVSEWFLQRLKEGKEGSALWEEIYEESDALAEWLKEIPVEQYVSVACSAVEYAKKNGPYQVWSAFLARVLLMEMDYKHRSMLLGVSSKIDQFAGCVEQGLRAAEDKKSLDYHNENKQGIAVASGLIADILHSTGRLPEAMTIRLRDELPFYKDEGNLRMQAITWRKIADLHEDLGDIDEAIRIHREEEIEIFRDMNDEMEVAITKGRVADIITKHPRLGGIDEALRIREEEIAVFERLDKKRELAVSKAKLAEILTRMEKFEEALNIIENDVLPVFTRMEEIGSIATALKQKAIILLGQKNPDLAMALMENKVIPVFEKTGDIRSIFDSKIIVAKSWRDLGDIEKAVSLLEYEIIPVCKKFGHFETLAMAGNTLADIYMSTGKITKAIKIIKEEEIPSYKKLKDFNSLYSTLIEAGDILYQNKKYREAHSFFQEAVKECEHVRDERRRAWARGKIALILCSNGQFDEALNIYKCEELPAYQKHKDYHSIMTCQMEMASAYLERNKGNDRLEAKRLLCEALISAKELNAEETNVIQEILRRNCMSC